MADIIYIKYNRTRKKEFQMKTSILSEAGVVSVEKLPLQKRERTISVRLTGNMKN